MRELISGMRLFSRRFQWHGRHNNVVVRMISHLMCYDQRALMMRMSNCADCCASTLVLLIGYESVRDTLSKVLREYMLLSSLMMSA